METLPATQIQEREVSYVPYGAKDVLKLNLTLIKRYCCTPTKSGQLPSDADAINFMMLCRAQHLDPFCRDAYLVGYDTKNGPKFSQITAHSALLKRAELHPKFEGMISGVVCKPGWACRACEERGLILDTQGKPSICPICRGRGSLDEVEGDIVPDQQELHGGWAKVFYAGRQHPTYRRLLLAAYRGPFSGPLWEMNPAGQIVKCAEADALRSTFPTLLGGLYTSEERGLINLMGDELNASQGAQQLQNAPQPKRLPAPAAKMPPRATQRPNVVPLNHPDPEPKPEPKPEPQAAQAPPNEDARVEGELGLGPVVDATPAGPTMTEGQKQLSEVLDDAGVTFDAFKSWGEEQFGAGSKDTGILAWDTYASTADIPEKACRYVLRVQKAMIDDLKGGAR